MIHSIYQLVGANHRADDNIHTLACSQLEDTRLSRTVCVVGSRVMHIEKQNHRNIAIVLCVP